jgi:Holliday junction DNA helicase RuvA
VSPAHALAFGGVGDQVFLHIHHVVREDAQTLYGFPTSDERQVFASLLSAHGVGPSLALAILSVYQPDVLRSVVVANDVDALCVVPGVGKKTAARLLVELSSRLDAPVDAPLSASGAVGSDVAARTDLRDALSGLGYAPEEIQRALLDLPSDGETSELLRLALQRLAAA